ncbi:N-acetyl-gamma-glutamyl-phosphate reductase [Parasphaerochaeta coccoides]|uniref:N-acetyl-gamma-glutamyl-phosphate reductase n=1 Tax=Parasphaerochaeta coccoides (strain ATCC BAA-1237 / DSM 17374 / SPN1) TaxID=760011 RepID=F4GLE0_PARC1|nr:N-acetyl-gamma-glutamyl-phosphate reductase [Parasphaerochaeta coccoides]AEC02972.1 N-acetyl-gamma-glutamyl-phosphate reductase [Parasphaerochaeta coccoides DSM 17374]
MFSVGIIGITGYAGVQLAHMVARHHHARLTYAGSHSHAGRKLKDIHPHLASPEGDILLQDDDIQTAAASCDVIFLALPAGIAAGTLNEDILKKTVVIDLGADFRLRDRAVYEAWYKKLAAPSALLEKAVYGLVELHRDEIRNSRLIANPGCYTTCSILSLHPLLKQGLIEPEGIIIDAKSGVSGAGRELSIDTQFCEANESVKAYGVAVHRHTPEIEQELGFARQGGQPVIVQFTPHLIPMDRGILTTCYASLKAGVNASSVAAAYEDAYGKEKFIGMRPSSSLPQTRWVKGSNRCDIGWVIDERTGRIIVVGALDNLVKGAAGQALQNMNVVMGCDEDTGLSASGIFPI